MDQNRFNGKVVVVTGAGRGIGKAIAVSFAREGASVILNYNKSGIASEKIVDELLKEGLKAEAIQADVSRPDQAEKLIDQVVSEYSRIDVLVNNAGIRHDTFLAMMSEGDWQSVIDTNVKSIYNTCKWASRVMMSQRQGKMINVSSISALKGVPGQANYSASKGAIISFSRTLSVELAPYGIQVNVIAPGFVETDMVKDLKDRKDEYIEKIPMKRFGTPQDVSGGVLFLASRDADYITGHTLVVDGGVTS